MPTRRLAVVALVLAVLGLAPARAGAGPSAGAGRYQVIDRGDAVDVVVPGATADALTAQVVRQRLEVPLRGQAEGREVRPADPTVKSIEIRGRSQRVLSIKLFADHDAVVALAPRVRLQQEGADLRVTIPRLRPAAAVVAAAPAAPSTSAPLVAPIVPPPTPIAPTAAAPRPEAAAAVPATTSAPGPTAAAPAATAATAPTTTTSTSTAAPPRRAGGGLPTTTLVVVAAALALGAVAVLRRRRAGPLATTSLDVLASRSLGGKARVVWLAAGEREMVVAVTGQNVQILGQWRAGAGAAAPAARGTREVPLVDDEAPAGSAAAAGRDELDLGPRPHLSLVGSGGRAAASSPAVSGILRLRERLGQLTAADREPSGDPEADEQWAKEILAATGSRR